MSSSEVYHVQINFNQSVQDLHLVLINGNLEKIVDVIDDRLELQLPKGVYLLKMEFMDYYQEQYLSIEKDELLFLDLNYPITTPVMAFKTTHEYFSGPAEQYSTVCSHQPEQNKRPDFLLFVARYDRDMQFGGTPSDWVGNFRFYDISHTVDIQLDKTNSMIEEWAGCFCFSSSFAPGLYFLEYKEGENKRIFPVYIYEHYQTQYFIRYNQGPDFANARVFFTRNFHFKREFPEYFVLEKVLLAYANYKHYDKLTEEDFKVIVVHPYLVALVNILNKALKNGVKMIEAEELELPDKLYLMGDGHVNLSHQPPLMGFVLNSYLKNSSPATSDEAFAASIIEPASILDRVIDSVYKDIFWTSFSEIADPMTWKKLYTELLDENAIIPFSRQNIMKILKSKVMQLLKNNEPLINEKIDFLLGEGNKGNLEKLEGNVAYIQNVMKDVKDVVEMSKEFGVPPTMVLRNYTMYSQKYKAVKDSKAGELS
jgi:hypothetical protein